MPPGRRARAASVALRWRRQRRRRRRQPQSRHHQPRSRLEAARSGQQQPQPRRRRCRPRQGHRRRGGLQRWRPPCAEHRPSAGATHRRSRTRWVRRRCRHAAEPRWPPVAQQALEVAHAPIACCAPLLARRQVGGPGEGGCDDGGGVCSDLRLAARALSGVAQLDGSAARAGGCEGAAPACPSGPAGASLHTPAERAILRRTRERLYFSTTAACTMHKGCSL
jgi:hypothetical protein